MNESINRHEFLFVYQIYAVSRTSFKNISNINYLNIIYLLKFFFSYIYKFYAILSPPPKKKKTLRKMVQLAYESLSSQSAFVSFILSHDLDFSKIFIELSPC